MNELPEGWVWKKLGEVLNFIGGGTPDKSNKGFWNGDIPWASVKDIKEKYLLKTQDHISENGLKNSSSQLALLGELILITRISPGKTSISKIKTAINQDLKIVKPKIQVDILFIHYLFETIEKEIIKKSSGTTVLGIRLEILKDIDIPLPPLPVQHAIVTKIEEIFSELDHGVAQLKTARAQLKVYRQSVLKWAFEGRLTNEEESWKQVKLREIANAIDPQPSHRTPPVVEGGIPFVSIKDFDSELDKIDFSNARKVASQVLTEHLERYELKLGDFVIGKIGTIGKPVRMVLPQTYALSANIVLIQPRNVNATYLYYFFQSTIIEKALLAGTNATSQAAFGIQKVRELEIQLPSEQEQHLIVSEIERRLSVCDKLEETIAGSLKAAEVLRAGVLKRAFEGKLV